jgi:hypothetical protein
MSVAFKIKGLHTNNTDLPIINITQSLAQVGMVGEWDFMTFSGSDPKVMLDRSGNGKDANWQTAPTPGSDGITLGSANTNYARTGVTGLVSAYSALVVFKPLTGMLASCPFLCNWGAQQGSMLWTQTSGATLKHQMQVGSGAQQVFCDTVTPNAWMAVLHTVDDTGERWRNLIAATAYTGATGARASREWVIGGAWNGTDGATVQYINRFTTFGYAALYGRVVAPSEDATILSYVRAKMAARGVTI